MSIVQPQAVLGLVLIYAAAAGLSADRREIAARTIIAGIAVQFAIAAVVLNVDWVTRAFLALNDLVAALQAATGAGTAFVFGHLGGAEPPYLPRTAGSSFILAFQALPLLIVVSALTAVLTHWRILPALINLIGAAFARTLKISSATSLAAAANIVLGMVEAPLFIRSHLTRLTHSELFVLMTVGMSTVAGTVLVVYAGFLEGIVDNPAGHLMLASVISVPAAISIAQSMVPETGTVDLSPVPFQSEYAGTIDAMTTGTERGLKLCLSIAAMLITFVAAVELVNLLLGVLPEVSGEALSLQRILGWLCTPLAWLLGIPWEDARIAGELIGIKTVANEFIAIRELSSFAPGDLSAHSRLILVYALCGFANFGSLGILIGGLATLVPDRRAEILALGGRSLVSGTLATLSTGAVIGLTSQL